MRLKKLWMENWKTFLLAIGITIKKPLWAQTRPFDFTDILIYDPINLPSNFGCALQI